MTDPQLDPRFVAGIDLIGHTGATDFRIGYSDEEDGEPIVWYAVAIYQGAAEADAGLDPTEAVMRLCERIIDGGTCTHCGRATIFDPDPSMGHVVDEMLDAMGCRYKWDPEASAFQRSCLDIDRPATAGE